MVGFTQKSGSARNSPPQLRRGGAARREPDRAKPQKKRRRGGVDQKIDFLTSTTPVEALRPRLSPPQLRRGVLLVALILLAQSLHAASCDAVRSLSVPNATIT